MPARFASLARGALPRFSVSLVVFAAFLIVCWLHAADLSVYEALAALPDTLTRPHPFLDLRAVLQAGVCWRDGVDVYAPSACMGGGVFNYAPLLLRAAYLPIGPGESVPGGVILSLIFVLSLAWLPPPRSAAAFLVTAACALSTATFQALERGNFDVVMFAMTAAGLAWLRRHPARAVSGYLIFALAAAIKFYPAAALALMLREPLAKFLALAAAVLAAALAYTLAFGHASATAIAILPQSRPFLASFGAMDLPLGLSILANAGAQPPNNVFVAVCTRSLIVLAIIIAAARSPAYEKPLSQLETASKLFCLGGALIIALCFFAAENVEYRAIFLLLTMPAIWRMGTTGTGARRILLAAVPFLLWNALFRTLVRDGLGDYPALMFWLFRECVWWWVAVQLTAMVLCFGKLETLRLYKEASASFFAKKEAKKLL